MATRPRPPLANAHSEELSPQEQAFTLVYLDTEPLRAAGWPMPRAAAVTLIALAREVGLTVCLPEPVEAELATQFMRRFADADEKISKAWGAMEGVFRLANAVLDGAPHRPTPGEARAAYERAAIAARQAHGVAQVGRSERPLGEYFELALRQSPPFDADGRGFKDAVILMSVIDDLLRRAPASGLLVTRDTDFRGVEALAEGLGTQLIVRNVDDAVAILRRRLDAVARASYASAERQALELAQRELAMLTHFITENLEVPSSVLAEPVEQLIRFVGVHISSIKAVQADPPFSVLAPGQGVKLTFTLRAQLHADVMPIPETLAPATTVKVGDSVTATTDPSDRLVHQMMARQLRRDQKIVRRQVELDAQAVRTVDGFESLQPIAVRLKDVSIVEQLQDLLGPALGHRGLKPHRPTNNNDSRCAVVPPRTRCPSFSPAARRPGTARRSSAR